MLRRDEFTNVLSFLPFKAVCGSMRVSSLLQSTAVATIRQLTEFETLVASQASFEVLSKYARRLRKIVRPSALFELCDPNSVALFLRNNSRTLQTILSWIPSDVLPLLLSLCDRRLHRVTSARCVVSSTSAADALPLLLPSLTNLALQCGYADGSAIGTMLSSPSLHQLVALTVMRLGSADRVAVPPFLDALAAMSRLTELRLGRTALYDRGARYLAGKSQSLPALQVLILRRCRVREGGIRALGESFRTLKVFGVSPTEPSFADVLADSGGCIGAHRYFPALETALVLFPDPIENAELPLLRQSRPSLTIGCFYRICAYDVDMFTKRF